MTNVRIEPTIAGMTALCDRARKLHGDYRREMEGMQPDQALALMANKGDIALGLLPTMADLIARMLPRPIAEAPRDGRRVIIGYSDGSRPSVIASYGTAAEDAPDIGGMEGWISVDGDTVYATPDVYMPLFRMSDAA